MVKLILPGSKKRGDPPEILEGQCQKKQKMDVSVKIECKKILKALMTHKFGPVFNQPVDPIQLKIPDYFSIITHPMDLGTIFTKLEDNIYFSAEEFSADIKLTFSNAMRYNPPTNCVHLMAKEMNDLFRKIWGSEAQKLTKQSKSSTKDCKIVRKIGTQNSKASRNLAPKTSESKTVKKIGLNISVGVKKTEDSSKILMCSEEKPKMSCVEKVVLKKELMEALSGDLTGPLRGFLRKYGLIYSRKEKIESVFGSFGDDTLWELKKVVKGSLGTSIGKCTKGISDKGDLVKSQCMKGVSESRKLEEKSNIESRIRAARAAKEALIENAKSDLQKKRDTERERVEKMERTVTMDDNLMILRELEKLCQCSPIKNLEKIGLRLKEEYYYGYDYIDDHDDDADAQPFDELEDGEIF